MNRRSLHLRILFLVAIPLLAAVAVFVLVATLHSGVTPVPAAAASSASTDAPLHATAPPEPPEAMESPAQHPQPTPTSPADIIAVVDGTAIVSGALAEAYAVDRAMAHLTGVAPAAPERVLEQLINHQLVWQAMPAQAAADDTATRATLDALLVRADASAPMLATALAEESLSRAAFDRYFGRLVAVSQFASAEARQQGMAEDAYLRSLQRRAQISYGPAVAGLLEPPARTDAVTPPVAATPASQDAAPQDAVAPAALAPSGLPLAPAFALPALAPGDEPLRLDHYAGRPLVLSFWTTWCPYCLRQTPVLVDGYARHTPDGIAYLGVAVKEDRAAVAPYVAEHRIPYPIALDEDGATAALYGVAGYPTTLFVTADGRIAARHLGALTKDALDEYVAQLRSSPPE